MPLLLCPNDNSSMQTVDRDGVQFDMCPSCRGVWLDWGELEKLMAAAQAPAQASAPAAAPRQSPPPQSGFAGGFASGFGERGEYGERGESGERGEYGFGGHRKKRGSIFDIFD